MEESSFQFRRPIIKDLSYKMKNDYNSENKSSFVNQYQVNIIRHSKKSEAIVELTITLGQEGDKSENIPFILVMTIGSVFNWQENLTKDLVEDLLNMNAPALLLSYARPIVSTITANSKGAYDIPFVNFKKKKTR